MIKGKQGRFRQNLLGKRVDYSGVRDRGGPDAAPERVRPAEEDGAELFKPSSSPSCQRRGLATTIKAATKNWVEREEAEVWDISRKSSASIRVLNRAPTCIARHPGVRTGAHRRQGDPAASLVCTAFNADFDGDQMAVKSR